MTTSYGTQHTKMLQLHGQEALKCKRRMSDFLSEGRDGSFYFIFEYS